MKKLWQWMRRPRGRKCLETLVLDQECILTRWRESDGTYSVQGEDIAGGRFLETGFSRSDARLYLSACHYASLKKKYAGTPAGRILFPL
jgi:hypothetical protein